MVALQEAATDRCDELAASHMEDIVRQDTELAEEAARASCVQGSIKVLDASAKVCKRGERAGKHAVASEKRTAGSGEGKEEEELVRDLSS